MAQRHWTPDEDAVLVAHPQASRAELSQQLGRTIRAIRHRQLALGIYAAPPPRRFTPQDDAIIRELAGTMRASDIAARLDRTPETVTQRMKRLGISTQLIWERVQADALTCAWVAGMFEGEGTVTINSGGRRPYTRIVVSVTSTDHDMIDVLQQYWPASRITSRTPQNSPHARIAWTWSLSSYRASVFLQDILSFIRTKRVRAKMELALEAHAAKRRGGHKSEEYHATQEAFLARMRVLNKRGAA